MEHIWILNLSDKISSDCVFFTYDSHNPDLRIRSPEVLYQQEQSLFLFCIALFFISLSLLKFISYQWLSSFYPAQPFLLKANIYIQT